MRISLDTDIDAFVADIAPYAALGFERVQLGLLGTEPTQVIQHVVSKIVPRLQDV